MIRNTVSFPLTPLGKPRMTQRDRWKKRPVVLRYWEYADQLREMAGRVDFEVPDQGMSLTFMIPAPRSLSKKKRLAMEGTPHKAKPDIDNLLKGFLDVLLPEGDSGVWSLGGLQKIWTAQKTGRIIVSW